MTAGDLDRLIRRIPDHPKPGILFYDLMPLLADAAGLDRCVEDLASWARPLAVDLVMGVEARGFIAGGALARTLGAGFVAARKPDKLPWERLREEYALEYGTDAIEVQRDAIPPGARVLVHDDLLATGGTAAAACALAERSGATIVGVCVIVELDGLGGRTRLGDRPVHSLLSYTEAPST